MSCKACRQPALRGLAPGRLVPSLVLAASLLTGPAFPQGLDNFGEFPDSPTGGARLAPTGGDPGPLVLADAPVTRSAEDERDLVMTPLPLLPPERSTQKFSGDLALAGLTVADFISLLSGKPFLNINMLIASGSPALDSLVELALTDITVGEAFALVLQLNNLKAVRFNENTLIILDATDQRTFGIKRRKLYRLTYVSTQAVIDFVTNNPNLSRLVDLDNVIEDATSNTILVIDSADRIQIFDHVISLLDAKSNKITAQIPLSHIDLAVVEESISKLPAEIQARLNPAEMIYSEQGRTLIVYDTPEDVALLRDLIRQIDIGLKQALIDVSILEVSETLARDIGLSLRNSSLSVTSIDKLWNLDRVRADPNVVGLTGPTGTGLTPTRLTYNLIRQGGNTIANPKIRVVDQQNATINVGQVRNVQVQTSQFATNLTANTQQTTFNTQEVPIGVTLDVSPQIHNDGTITLELNIQDEEIISISEIGVDRTTRNSNTTLRMRDGETVIMGGFINRNISYDRTPIPVLGQLPLLNKLFRTNSRNKLASELIILLTPYILDYDPVTPKAEAKQIPPGKPITAENFGFSQEATKPDIKTTTTRWLETETGRTKVIYDAMGEVIYQRAFPKEGAAETPAKLGPSGKVLRPDPAGSTLESARGGGPLNPPDEAIPDTENWGGLMDELSSLANGG